MVVIKFCCLKALGVAVLYDLPAPEVGTRNRSHSENSIHRMSPIVAQKRQGKQRGMDDRFLEGRTWFVLAQGCAIYLIGPKD